MLNVLVVSMSAPPQKGAESIQVGRYLKHLTKVFNIELVTTNTPKKSWIREDKTILNSHFLSNRIEIFVYWNRYVSKLLKVFAKQSPEQQFVNSFEKVIKLVKKKPDIIYSRALPHGSTLLAKQLKKHYNVPWVMHLSDPWEDNPFITNPKQSEEEACIMAANVVTLTSELAVQFYKKKYPVQHEKFMLMPNVYDDELKHRKSKTINNNCYTITHTGNFYGKRTPKVILQVLDAMRKKDSLKNIVVIFAGEMDAFSKVLFQEYKNDHIKIIGSVSLQESIKLQERSNILLVIDKEYEAPSDLITLPSKLVDYSSLAKPIFAITPKNSSTQKFIADYKCGKSFAHDELHEIEKYILGIINKSEIMGLQYLPPIEYSIKHNVSILEKIFKQLV